MASGNLIQLAQHSTSAPPLANITLTCKEIIRFNLRRLVSGGALRSQIRVESDYRLPPFPTAQISVESQIDFFHCKAKSYWCGFSASEVIAGRAFKGAYSRTLWGVGKRQEAGAGAGPIGRIGPIGPIGSLSARLQRSHRHSTLRCD